MMEFNLFGASELPAQPPKVVTPQEEVVQSGLSKGTEIQFRPVVPRSIALPIYEAAIKHLLNHDTPHFTPFRIKSAKSRLKWCIDHGNPKTAHGEAKPDMLTIYWEVERIGQNTDNPELTYTEWERMYSRALKPSTTPKAIGMKPRKARTASGSRRKSIQTRDPS